MWRDLEPDLLAAALHTISVISLICLGWFAEMRGALVLLAVLVVAGALEETLVDDEPAERDPFCSSPLTGVIFGAPFILGLIAAGGFARWWRRT
jgi:hypothetical protein